MILIEASHGHAMTGGIQQLDKYQTKVVFLYNPNGTILAVSGHS